MWSGTNEPSSTPGGAQSVVPCLWGFCCAPCQTVSHLEGVPAEGRSSEPEGGELPSRSLPESPGDRSNVLSIEEAMTRRAAIRTSGSARGASKLAALKGESSFHSDSSVSSSLRSTANASPRQAGSPKKKGSLSRSSSGVSAFFRQLASSRRALSQKSFTYGEKSRTPAVVGGTAGAALILEQPEEKEGNQQVER